ncbi:MAG: hypothetical protein LAT67_04125 [Balneolales bacterium]|nr:hypothetical protein [Balneolales bacterium]
MKLFIHFGLYKAGSSYLQYICANNRQWLAEKKIFFPASNQDLKMQTGSISAGNAHNLSQYLRASDKKSATSILSHHIKNAKKLKCDCILLTAEDLAHIVSTKKGLNTLIEISKELGIIQIKLLAFFRELVDHAISTYKHRAKTGKHPDFLVWLQNNYETPRLINNLIKTYNSSQNEFIEWSLRAFKKDSSHLVNTFFIDWLSIGVPALPSKTSVNQSVTLSEVIVLSELKNKFPLVIDYFMEKLKELPNELKFKDTYVEQAFRKQAYKVINEENQLFYDFDILIPEQDNFSIFDRSYSVINSYQIKGLSPMLSPHQLKMIFECTHYLSTIKGRFFLLRRMLKHVLNKLFFINNKK